MIKVELEDKIATVLELLIPYDIPTHVLKGFTRSLVDLLQSMSRTPDQLDSLVNAFKHQLPSNLNVSWERFNNMIRQLFMITSTEEKLKFINSFYLQLQENPMVSPARQFGFTRDNVNYYNQFGSPVDKNKHLSLAPSVYAESFEAIDKFSDRRSIASGGYVPSRLNNTSSLKELSDQFYMNNILEDDILKYAFFTLLGVTSDMFPIKSGIIHIPNGITNSTSGVLHLLFEVALLYISLSDKLENYKSIRLSPMKKSLITQINEELSLYTSKVNFLSSSSKVLSVKYLYNELYDNILRLRICEQFLKDFEYSRGDEYASKFHSLKIHGNLLINRMATDFYNSLISFYIDYNIKWLIYSKLESAFDEYFIVNDNNKLFIPYGIKEERIPDFIPNDIAQKIFIIGKTYIFLTAYCKELEWANTFSQKFAIEYNKITQTRDIRHFLTIIERQYYEIVGYSQKNLHEKLYYKETIQMLKNVLLMGKNDLIDAIINNGKDLLNSSSPQLTYNSTRILQNSVHQSSLRNFVDQSDRNFLINKLDARVLDFGHGSLGWDIFTLEYDIQPPLSILLNVNRSDGRKEYLRIFNFLWRFKKNDYFGNREMLKSKELIHSFRKIKYSNGLARDLLNKLAKLSTLRSQLQQFNSKTELYYFQSIINKNFDKLEKDLNLNNNNNNPNTISEMKKLNNGLLILSQPLQPKSNTISIGNNSNLVLGTKKDRNQKLLNIEEIDNIHNTFLNNILAHKLLSGKVNGQFSGQPYPTSLVNCLQLITEFMNSLSNLHDIAHNIYIQLNLENHEELETLLDEFSEISLKLVRYHKEFKKLTYIFIRDIKNDGDTELHILSKMLR